MPSKSRSSGGLEDIGLIIGTLIPSLILILLMRGFGGRICECFLRQGRVVGWAEDLSGS